MPVKHQAESYRTINGERWESWGDFNEEAAKGEARDLRNLDNRVRCFKIGGGMVRIFLAPTDRDVDG